MELQNAQIGMKQDRSKCLSKAGFNVLDSVQENNISLRCSYNVL